MLKKCLGCMEEFDNEYRVCPFCGYIVGTQPEEAIHIRPGSLLHNRYIVGKVLGYGGFGVTYIGWDGRLEQKVAIKEYLPSDFSTRMPGQSQVTVFNGEKSEQFYDGLRKFVEEAKRLAKFQNEPGIVKIFDSFEENDTAYIVMEYLDGETLTKYLERVGTIPADEAVEMLLPVMKSLEVVHSEGILHRDIAPDNIFLTKDGEVKLIDFGASRYATTSHSKSLTVIIKQGYSPEEQYRSRGDQGPHTDVYALSATLYKMITGTIPPDAMERRAKFETKKKDILVKPHKFKKDLSHIYENAILNALNVRIEDRTSTIREFVDELTGDKPAKRRAGKIEPLDFYEWPAWLKIVLPIFMISILVFATLMGTGVIKFKTLFSEEIKIPEEIKMVPDVVDLYYKDAYELLKGSEEDRKKLSQDYELEYIFEPKVDEGGTVKAKYRSAGIILSQEPAAGTYINVVDEDNEVVLTISGGNKVDKPKNGLATVPFVQFDTQKAAIKKITTAGLKKPKIKKKNDNNFPEGTVISQSIDAGTKIKTKDKNKKKNIVTLTVSAGPAAFKMPDVIGKTQSEAEKILKEKDLKVKIEFEQSDDNFDKVVRQSVKAGKKIKRGSTVTLYVAVKRNEKIVTVANVVGMLAKEAKKALEKQGFEVAEAPQYSDSVASGKVIYQSPVSGTTYKKDDVKNIKVTIIVSEGPNPDSTTKPTTTKPTTTKPTTTKPTTTESTTKPTTTQAQIVTIYFNSMGGSVSPSSIKAELGSRYGDLSLPTPTRKGYTFNCWKTSMLTGGAINNNTHVNLTGDTNEIYLYADWTANKYTVTLEPNGGSISKTKVTVTYDSLYSLYLPKPKKDGYTFEGWYKNPNLSGSPISLISTVKTTSDHTLYAKWSYNAVSDWVNESSVPAGAEIVEKKYIYDVTDYKTSSSSSMSGYVLDTSKGNNGVSYDYSAWSYGDWTTEKKAETELVVKYDEKIEEKVTGYKMYTYMTQENVSPYHRMYRDYSIKPNLAAYGARESYGEHYYEANWTVDQFNRAKNSINDRVSRGGGEITYAGKNYGNKMLYYLPGSGWEHMYYVDKQNTSKTTYYKYKSRTKSTVYNFKKVETKESSSYPSGSNVSNIRTMVKYREK